MFGSTVRSYYTCVASSGNGVIEFPFDAAEVRLYAESSGPLWVDFASTAAGANSNSFRMSSDDSPLSVNVARVDTLAYGTTTTAIQFRVWAMG